MGMFMALMYISGCILNWYLLRMMEEKLSVLLGRPGRFIWWHKQLSTIFWPVTALYLVVVDAQTPEPVTIKTDKEDRDDNSSPR